MEFNSIGKKLNIINISVAVIAIVIGYLILTIKENKLEEDTYERYSKQLHQLAKERMNFKLKIGIGSAVSIVNDGNFRDALSSEDREWMKDIIKNVSNNMKKYTNNKNVRIQVHTKDNKSFVRSWTDKHGDDLSKVRKTVVQVNQTKKPINALEVGKMGVYFRSVVPVIDEAGEHLGSMELMQGFNSIAKLFDKKEKGGFLVLVDKNKMTGSYDSSKKFGNYIISQNFVNKGFLSDAKTIDLNTLFKEDYIITDKYFYSYINLIDFDGKKVGIILLAYSADTVTKAIEDGTSMMYMALSLIIFIVIAIIIIVTFSVKKYVSTPLKSFEDGLLHFFKYINGESNSAKEIDIYSSDEIGSMAKVVNENIVKSKENIEDDRKLVDAAVQVVKELEKGDLSQRINISASTPAMNELKNILNEMAESFENNINDVLNILDNFSHYNYTNKANTKGLIAHLEKLSNGVNELGNSISTMLQTSSSDGNILEESAKTLAEDIENLNSISNQVASSLQTTTELTEKATSGLNAASEQSHQVASQANEIKSVISVISDIADQTNLLALNAAIEAARAGEHGRGFAVVADEVRKLAERTQKSLSEIDVTINTLVQSVSDSVDNISTQTGEINKINDSMVEIENVSNSNLEISSKIERIASSISEISNKIKADIAKKKF